MSSIAKHLASTLCHHVVSVSYEHKYPTRRRYKDIGKQQKWNPRNGYGLCNHSRAKWYLARNEDYIILIGVLRATFSPYRIVSGPPLMCTGWGFRSAGPYWWLSWYKGDSSGNPDVRGNFDGDPDLKGNSVGDTNVMMDWPGHCCKQGLWWWTYCKGGVLMRTLM